MKATDLIVGDWIQVKRGFDGHLTNEKIKGLLNDNSEPYPITLTTEETVSLDDIIPIPLTEEILVKNGFKKDNNGDYEINDGIVIVMDWKGKSEHFACAPYEVENCFGQYHYLYVELFECKYVHQLQHLLRIAGVQKEIEL